MEIAVDIYRWKIKKESYIYVNAMVELEVKKIKVEMED